jgi:hypothetical protein
MYMPSHDVHREFARMVMGDRAERYKWVDAVMDMSAPINGANHRKDIVHNPLFIYALSGFDANALLVSLLHSILDTAYTGVKVSVKKVSRNGRQRRVR